MVYHRIIWVINLLLFFRRLIKIQKHIQVKERFTQVDKYVDSTVQVRHFVSVHNIQNMYDALLHNKIMDATFGVYAIMASFCIPFLKMLAPGNCLESNRWFS